MPADSNILESPDPSVETLRRPALPATADLRVLHVINGEHYAGAERVQDLLALRLPEFGVQPSFACVKPNRFAEMRQSQNTPLVNVAMKSRFDLRAGWHLAAIVRAEKFDVIHTHTPRAALVGQITSRLTGVPMVHHVHGHTATEIGNDWRAWLNAKTEKMSLARARAIVVVSPTAARYITSWGVPDNRVHYVSNGVPARKEFRDRATPHANWTLGCVALFRPRKGLEILLEALARLHHAGLPIHLKLIGGFETPQYREQALRLAQDLGVTKLVEWRGFQKNMDAELDAIDLLVLPSVLAEGMPMAVLEALAAGVPPIGSRVDGISDCIRHGHDGLLVEPGNPAALADAITSVIEGEYDWQTLRRNAIEVHSKQFSDRSMANGVAEIYRLVLEKNNRGLRG